MTRRERYRRIVADKEMQISFIRKVLNAMVEDRFEYDKKVVAFGEFDRIAATDTKTDTGSSGKKTRDNAKSRKLQQIM